MGSGFCTECGKPLNTDDKFCTGCGAVIPVQGLVQGLVQSPAQPYYTAPYSTKPKSKKGVVIAISVAASVFVIAAVIFSLFMFTDLFNRNSSQPQTNVRDREYRDIQDDADDDDNDFDNPEKQRPEGIRASSSALLELCNSLNADIVVLSSLIENPNDLLQHVYVFLDERGLVINLQTSAIFAGNGTAFNMTGMDVMKVIGESIDGFSNLIRVEGYTDNIPVSTPDFPNNESLSLHRAQAVSEALLYYCIIEPERLRVLGFGTDNPIADNSIPEGRLRNNRVEITINHEFEASFLETYFIDIREYVFGNDADLDVGHDPGRDPGRDAAVAEDPSIVGFWMTEWAERDGSEIVMDVAFNSYAEFFMLIGWKESESAAEVYGIYYIDNDMIHVVGYDSVSGENVDYTFIFRIEREQLIMGWEGMPQHTFNRAVPPYPLPFSNPPE